MAVVVTAASGYDLCYVWRSRGLPELEKSVGGYYLNTALSGEAEGRWFGPGGEAFGLAIGRIVDRGPYDAAYEQIDRRSGQKPRRARGKYVPYEANLARLTAAGPHATSRRTRALVGMTGRLRGTARS